MNRGTFQNIPPGSGPCSRPKWLLRLSEGLVRASVWLVARLFYPLQVHGRENVPGQGGVLLISNHVSYVDWLLLQAALKRPVRFLIGKPFYQSPWLNPFVRVARVIPIPSEIRPREVVEALRSCGRAIGAGEVVCVFAEGGITRSGQLMPFQRGFEKILREVEAPVVPVAVVGMWGSLFSFAGGKAFWKRPERWRRPVTVIFGRPLPSTSRAGDLQRAVAGLVANAKPKPAR